MKQPAVAVRILEGGKGPVGATAGIWPRQRGAAEGGEKERLTHLGAVGDELRARRRDVGHHEIQILG